MHPQVAANSGPTALTSIANKIIISEALSYLDSMHEEITLLSTCWGEGAGSHVLAVTVPVGVTINCM